MTIFGKVKKMAIASRKTDEAFYSVVAREMEENVRHNGLWIKALEQAAGNKERQLAEYIKLRVQSLRDDLSMLSAQTDPRKRIPRHRDINEFIAMLYTRISVEEVEHYLSGMNSAEIRKFVNIADSCEEYPIHVAMKEGRVDLAKWLLEAGANPEVQNYWGKTPADIAAKSDNHEALNLLRRYSK
jgi:hypothetical protein